ncbi:MAG: HypC/HybG/HupF family hydrogenase formation chaperone [Sulfolobales archaeon]
MCWGVLGKLVRVDGVEGEVEVGGATIRALIAVEEAKPGDVVLLHAGVVIEKLDRESILANLTVYYDLVKYHYTFNGLSEKEAYTKAREDLVKLAQDLGVSPEELLKVMRESEREQEAGASKPESVPESSFSIDYVVQLAETDYLQVMHYTNYVRVCERAFMAMLSSAGISYSKLIHEYGLFIPTVEVSAKIRSPSRLDNTLRVYVWLEEIGRKHLKYRCVVHNLTTGRVAADIEHVAVCTDTAITSSHELPEDIKKALGMLVPGSSSQKQPR